MECAAVGLLIEGAEAGKDFGDFFKPWVAAV
jgi:hypothetical protein